jgi:hypothetical protein
MGFRENVGSGRGESRSLILTDGFFAPEENGARQVGGLDYVGVDNRDFRGSQKTEDPGYLITQSSGSYNNAT